jgi:dimethylargininase
VNPSCPDAVFVEDVAVVFDQLAVITSMGSESRRAELPAMRAVLQRHREVVDVRLPATLEGGDVLRIGKTLFVGESARTNKAGIAALDSIARPLGFTVVPVKVPGCLHLKTCITALDDQTCVVNPQWLDCEPFKHLKLVEVSVREPFGANVVRLADVLLVNAACAETNEKIQNLRFTVDPVDISEFGKAEAGLTCMSLLFT